MITSFARQPLSAVGALRRALTWPARVGAPRAGR